VDTSFLRQFYPRNLDSFAYVPSVGRSGGIITVCVVLFFLGWKSFVMVMLSLLNFMQQNQIPT
jgi:hypothetical protein